MEGKKKMESNEYLATETKIIEEIKPLVDTTTAMEAAFIKVGIWKLDAQEQVSYCKDNGTADWSVAV